MAVYIIPPPHLKHRARSFPVPRGSMHTGGFFSKLALSVSEQREVREVPLCVDSSVAMVLSENFMSHFQVSHTDSHFLHKHHIFAQQYRRHMSFGILRTFSISYMYLNLYFK